jgi:murein DD-endopeptidase MepM/ murein hydrolase activator NlpD
LPVAQARVTLPGMNAILLYRAVPVLVSALLTVPAPAAGSSLPTPTTGSTVPAVQPGDGTEVIVAAYRSPLAGEPRVTRRFAPPAQRWLPGHRGVDLAGTPGEPVRAAGPGVVSFAGRVAGTGVVSVQHPGGLRTTYQPVSPRVSAGDVVAAGDPIGELAAGHPGCPVEACLHWGLRSGETYLDPLVLLGLGRVRLLPLTADAYTTSGR